MDDASIPASQCGAVKHAKKYLEGSGYDLVSFELLEDRFFSTLFSVKARSDSDPSLVEFVLKVGKTHRNGRYEYEQYQFLRSLGVNTLSPVFFSEELNYLITKKEDITPVSSYLKVSNERQSSDVAKKFGKFIDDLRSKFDQAVQFDSHQFIVGVKKRVDRIGFISLASKKSVMHEVIDLAADLSACLHPSCLFSDFAFGNVHLDAKGNIMLLDLGDASVSLLAETIAYIYLTCIFIFPNTPASRRKKVSMYKDICRQIDLSGVSNKAIRIFVIKHILNMMDFAEKKSCLDSGFKGFVRKIYNYTYDNDLRKELSVSRDYLALVS